MLWLLSLTWSESQFKNNDNNKKPLDLNYWDVNNLHGWTMSQKLTFGGFKWIEETFQLNDNLMEKHNDDSDAGHFLAPELMHYLFS